MPFRARLAAFRLCLSLSRFSHSSPRAAALFAVHAFLVVERLSIVFMLHGELVSWLHCEIKVIGYWLSAEYACNQCICGRCSGRNWQREHVCSLLYAHSMQSGV